MEKIKLNLKRVMVNELRPNTWNPKDSIEESPSNKIQFDHIRKSLKQYGSLAPVIVRVVAGIAGYEIIDGFHRWLAHKEDGYEGIDINDLGEMSEAEARALTISMEQAKVPIDGLRESEVLAGMYGELLSYDEMAKFLPYDSEIIRQKVELLNFDFDDLEKKGQEEMDEMEGVRTFRFKVKSEQVGTCETAITKTEKMDEFAFIEMCNYYLNNKEKTDDGEEEAELLENTPQTVE